MNKKTDWEIIISCEHAANAIPNEYQYLFKSAGDLLATHAAYDIGAAELAKHLADILRVPLFMSEYSRLVADLNRHSRHPMVFSRFTRNLNKKEKQQLLKTYHAPYRFRVENHIRQAIASGNRVLHLSVHSFTPVLKGKVRTTDIGFLYDPKRTTEKKFVSFLMDEFKDHLHSLRYRRNYPYLGISDSLTTYLRKQFPDNRYAGIEFEINQQIPLGDFPAWESFKTGFAQTINTACKNNSMSSLSTI